MEDLFQVMQNKFAAATLAVAEYAQAREDYWASVATGTVKSFPVDVDGEIYIINYKISSTGLVHYERMNICKAIGATRDTATARNFYHNAMTSNLKAQSHPRNAKKKFDTAWLTDLGVEHLCDYHRKSHALSVEALVRGIRDAHLLDPFGEIKSTERIEAETCVRIKKAVYERYGIVLVKHTVRIEDGNATRRVLDLWSEELLLNIECNEHNHRGYPADYEEKREADIKKAKGDNVLFFKYNPHAADFDIDDVIEQILDLPVFGG
jgi:hypothetical protein